MSEIIKSMGRGYPALAEAKASHIQLALDGKWTALQKFELNNNDLLNLKTFANHKGNVAAEIWFSFTDEDKNKKNSYIGIGLDNNIISSEKEVFFTDLYQKLSKKEYSLNEAIELLNKLCDSYNIERPKFTNPDIIALGAVNNWNETGEFVINLKQAPDIKSLIEVLAEEKPELTDSPYYFTGLEAQFEKSSTKSWVCMEVSHQTEKGYKINLPTLQKAFCIFGVEIPIG